MVNLREADIKRAVDDFLQYGQNQGRWVFFRLNAGDFIETRGETRRRIKGCQKGTSDFEVIKGVYVQQNLVGMRCIFIEVKSPIGKQSKDQRVFQAMVEAQGAEYYLVRSAEEVEQIL